jgi:hypothetical protein
MAPGNVADGVGHRKHRQTKCECDTGQADAQIDGGGALGGDELGSEHSAAAAAKDESEGSEEFRSEFVFHRVCETMFVDWSLEEKGIHD